MKNWTDDKLKKEIAKGIKHAWSHLPALEAELASRHAATPEKTHVPKLG